MIRKFVCVEPCSGYAIAAHGIHEAEFQTAFAFDNNCWDEKSQRFKLDAVATYNSNFKYDDGSPVCHLKDIKDVTGKIILDEVARITGWKSVHLMFGGPPCQDWTKLNAVGSGTKKCLLMLEYLRLVTETKPLVAVIEQVPDFITAKKPEKKKIRDQFFGMLKDIDYNVAYTVMCSADYEVPQVRYRVFAMLVRNDLKTAPIFPRKIIPKVAITDFIDIDGYSSGHFGEPMKSVSLHPQVCTVTSSSPFRFFKGSDSWKPTIGELLWCQSINPGSYNYVGSLNKLKQGIGNGVPAKLAYHLAKCVREKILEPAYLKQPELF